ncbi:MAG: hypothetical protein J2O49_11140, partial [Sciscionella sp.]|nr:hypothetical protein [Sciscionella sp.]
MAIGPVSALATALLGTSMLITPATLVTPASAQVTHAISTAAGTPNPAPAVVPALQQWNGGVGLQHLGPQSRIVLDPADHGAL